MLRLPNGSRLFPDASLVKASAPESRSATQVAPLEISDSLAELSGLARDMLLLQPAANYSSCLSPPPFPSAISPQSCTADHWKVLILKFTQTPNTFGTIVLVFLQQQNHFMQKSHKTSHCAQYTHKKYETYPIIVRCCFFLSTKQHIYITTSIYLLQEALI